MCAVLRGEDWEILRAKLIQERFPHLLSKQSEILQSSMNAANDVADGSCMRPLSVDVCSSRLDTTEQARAWAILDRQAE